MLRDSVRGLSAAANCGFGERIGLAPAGFSIPDWRGFFAMGTCYDGRIGHHSFAWIFLLLGVVDSRLYSS